VPNSELERQRLYMETQTLELKRQLQRKEERQRTTQRKQFAESSSLLKEVNELRFENHTLHQKLSMLQAQLRTLQLHQRMSLGSTGGSFARVDGDGMAMEHIVNRSKSASLAETPSPSSSASLTRSGRVSRPVSSSASVRTPDSFFQHRPSSRQGRLHRGSTTPLVRDAVEKRGVLEGVRVGELVKMLESNTSHIREQEKEIQRLRYRLAELLHKELSEDDHISLEGIPPRPASERMYHLTLSVIHLALHCTALHCITPHSFNPIQSKLSLLKHAFH
jgi:hypothetical protein